MNSCISNLNSLFLTVRRNIFAKKTNRELKRISMTDAQTGVYNRSGYEMVLRPFVDEQRAAGKISLLLFIDINRMKTINDKYGHLNGDLAIKATADAMRSILSDGWLLAR